MKHLVESSGRMVPALDFAPGVGPQAEPVGGLTLGVSPCGLPVVERIHPRDGQPESFGVFASPALAAHFIRTFGGAA